MTSASGASIERLPDELMVLALGHRPATLCRARATNRRFNALASDEALWQTCHEQRWKSGRPDAPPAEGWRVDYGRRHRQDAAVMPQVQQLLEPSERRAAWAALMRQGERISDHVRRLLQRPPDTAWAAEGDGWWQRGERPSRDELWEVCCREDLRPELCKVLRGLRQTALRSQWEALHMRAAAAARGHGAMPSVEEGALLLVAWNASEDELCRPGELESSVTQELDALAARLQARLPPEAKSIEVVTELAKLMFQEEGFSGNQLNYYDPNNSLLDHVLTARTGIPISLSVVFAAVSERVGVPLDMIGLPGHFLLGTRPSHPEEERVFVDAFHGGAILHLPDCAQIVAHYGVAWSADLAQPVPHTEVWGRMVRNLLNCHKRNGDVDQVVMHEHLLPQPPPLPVPYPGGDSSLAAEQVHSHTMLRQLLQSILQMQEDQHAQ